mgnify:CR=1 FL=1
MTVRFTIEDLPPIYGIRAVTWAGGTPAHDCYVGGFLTMEGRQQAIKKHGWRVAE